jgi:K+-transporting ATPase ATPase C chain
MNQSNDNFWTHLRVSIVATIVLTVVVSGIYPAIVWGLSQLLFPWQANGSLIDRDGNRVTKDDQAVGSALLGQNFSDAKYFHPRPSSAGNGYDPTSSGGSNLGPTSAKLINGTTKKDDKGNEVVDFDGVHDRIVHYCVENNIEFDSSTPLKEFQDKQGSPDDVKLIKAFNADGPLVFMPKREIPADAVTASGSGLDPHISVENAKIQAGRVAAARKISPSKVNELIGQFTEGPDLGFLGDPRVNVLRLNLALDKMK